MCKIFFNIAFSLLCGTFIIFALSFLGFIFNVAINPFYTIAGIIATLAIFSAMLYFEKVKVKNIFLFNFALILLIVICGIFATQTWDFSYDGRTYHQLGINLMKNGYNPVYDLINIKGGIAVWIECYPKFSEICAANIFSLINNIETGKIFNSITIIIAFCYTMYVFLKNQFFKFNNRKISVLVPCIFAFILIYNPIVIAQLATYYIDGLLYLYFVVAALSITDFYLDKEINKLTLLTFIMSSVIIANIKFGGLLCIFCFILSGIFFIKNTEKLKSFYASVLIIISLILLSGINPYFTNIAEGRHPFYPLAGKNKIDIIKVNHVYDMADKSMPYKFFVSIFSAANNTKADKSVTKPVLKIPFTIHKNEIKRYGAVDLRIGGFGVFFSGIFILAILALIFTKYDTKAKGGKELYILVYFLFASPVFLNPENWWARYVPQLWGLVTFIVMSFYINGSNKKKRFAYLILLIMFINSLIINCGANVNAHRYKKPIEKIIKKHKEQNREMTLYLAGTPIEATFLLKLDNKHVKYKVIKKEEYLKNKDDFAAFPGTLYSAWKIKNL